MATSRSRGERFVTTRSPIETSPPVITSRPAIIRRSVDFPQPDGPTSTMNSPLVIVRLTSSTARTPPAYSFVTPSSLISAIWLSLPHSPHLDRGPDRMASSRSCKRSLKTFSRNHLQRGGGSMSREETEASNDAAPTITTVARLANVSVASASRALNGIRTRPDVHAKVLEAAEAIGYVPNAAARSLRSRRTDQIVFAMPDVANPVDTAMVSSIQEVARTGGFRLLLHSTGASAEDELETIRDLKRRFVDGLILCSLAMGHEHMRELEHAAAPIVVIGRPAAGMRVDTVRA